MNQDLQWAMQLLNKMSDDQRYAVGLFVQSQLAEQRKETEEVCSVARRLRDTLDAIKEAMGGASSYPETGVSIVDDVRDLKNAVLKYSETQADLVDERGRLTSAIGEWKKEEVMWKEREADLLSQLATQTERVRVLEDAIRLDLQDEDSCLETHKLCEHMVRTREALNQESLGDGGRGE